MKSQFLMAVGLSLSLQLAMAADKNEQGSERGQALFELTQQPVIKLAPSKPAKRPPSIKMQDIAPFISNMVVIDPVQLSHAPIIVDQDHEHLVSVPGDEIMVKSLESASIKDFWVVQKDKTYVDPITQKSLGVRANILAEAHLTQLGSPAVLELTKIYQEVKVGDHLIPKPSLVAAKRLFLTKPKQPIAAVIMDVEGSYIAAKNSVVILNQGEQAGIMAGALLAVKSQDHTHKVIGELLVIKSFPQLSIALVREASKSIRILDRVTNLA